jgi:hypothetical protein
MKKNIVLATSCMLLVFLSVLSSNGLSSTELVKIEIYKNFIEEQILKCKAKSRYLDSRSKNLRQYCRQEMEKAKFLNNSKEMLSLEMMNNQIEAKSYKMELFLHSRFLETYSE